MLARMLSRSPRSTVAMLLAASLLASPGLLAQGLGELSLDSALNEPLRASIELLEVSGLEESQLLIGIASPEEYEQAGLERSSLVSQIEFDVELQPLGSGRVTLTTRDRVNEPFLTLLVSARWPSGRVLRDYTVLLDLPGAPAQTAAGVTPPSDSAASGSTGAGAAASASVEGDSYAVQSGDSLWTIAEQTRPAADVSVPQMMIAIQRANEDAFVNNNVNRLISGRVLRIPAREEISLIEPAAAVAQINAQNREVGLTPLGGAATADAGGAARDELSVLGGDDATAAGGAGSSDLAATIAALEAELMLSEEDLDRARIENEELTAQLAELEEQIAILQNIIAIEDQRIAQLQDTLAEQAAATDEALAEASRAADALAAAGQAPAAPQGLVGQLLALLQNNLVFIGGALAVVLAVLGLLVARARRAREEDADDLDFTAEPAVAAADADSGEEQGFLARLLARFRRGKDEDDEYFDEDELAVTDPDARADARLPEIEVDEIPDELTGGLYADDEFEPIAQPAAAAGTAVAAADEEEDAAALASSVLDEVDALGLPEADADDAAGDAGAVDAAEEFEFDLTDAEPVAAAVSSAPEAFEFKVAPASEPVAEPASAAAEPELESFTFNLEPAAVAAPAESTAAAAEPEIETFEFKPAASGDSFDLGSLTFDESDAKRADDEESAYTPRTNMDECDTKLDLAVAYEAMGDIDGAVEILDEVIAEGKPAQVEEAQRLKAKWQDA